MIRSVQQVIEWYGVQIRIQNLDVVKHPILLDGLIRGIAIRFHIITAELKQKYHRFEATSLGEKNTLVKNSRFFFLLIQ
jgi:hypothetical protein